MLHIPVSSSNLSTVAYENNTLEIRFKNNTLYRYYHVPEYIYLGLINATSKGGYHAKYIKNTYPVERIA